LERCAEVIPGFAFLCPAPWDGGVLRLNLGKTRRDTPSELSKIGAVGSVGVGFAPIAWVLAGGRAWVQVFEGGRRAGSGIDCGEPLDVLMNFDKVRPERALSPPHTPRQEQP
jgi:hypothetical protein